MQNCSLKKSPVSVFSIMFGYIASFFNFQNTAFALCNLQVLKNVYNANGPSIICCEYTCITHTDSDTICV